MRSRRDRFRGPVAGRACWCAAFVLVAAAFAPTATAAGAGGGWYDWPGMKKCQEFRADSLQVKVYASKGTATQDRLSCRKANRIMRAWWRGPKDEIDEHSGGHYTLERFPGWRCDSGAGGGSCTRGDRIAGYQNR